MNILILSPFFPWPLTQGGKIRVFNVIKYLSRNHKITLACVSVMEVHEYGPLANFCEEIVCVGRKRSTFRDLLVFLFGKEAFNYVRFSSATFREALQRLVERRRFDLIQIEFSMMWQYADIFRGMPAVFDAHNIEADIIRQNRTSQRSLLKKLLYSLEEKRLRDKEEEAWRECDLCFAVSEKEREGIASKANPSKVFVAPNGADTERFAYLPKEDAGRSLLFIGGLEYLPNLASAQYLLSDIFPAIRTKTPEAKLYIVGRELGKIAEAASGEGIELHENVPDVLPWFRKAEVLLVPLKSGAGTRIKILEAMSAGLPVVTTLKGCEGLEVENGKHLMIADSSDDFAHAVQKLLHDYDLRKTITRNARSLVEEKYSWEKIVGEMEHRLKIVKRET